MSHSRKDFLRLSALAGGAVGLGAGPLSAASNGSSDVAPSPRARPTVVQEAPRKLNILILGGTGFIGPFLVQSALARGHEVTLFNRGSGRALFPYLETLEGDRNGDYESLRGRRWDVVIDNARSQPEWVEMAADNLKDLIGFMDEPEVRTSTPTQWLERLGADRLGAVFIGQDLSDLEVRAVVGDIGALDPNTPIVMLHEGA